MLSRAKRLRAVEVREIIRSSYIFRGTFLSTRYRAGPRKLRVAVVVPKKFASRAVDRNQLRRALYRAVHQISLLNHTLPLGDAVLFLQKAPPPPLTPTFVQELSLLLKKIQERHV